MLGNSWLAAQLAASQGGFSSVKLVSSYFFISSFPWRPERLQPAVLLLKHFSVVRLSSQALITVRGSMRSFLQRVSYKILFLLGKKIENPVPILLHFEEIHSYSIANVVKSSTERRPVHSVATKLSFELLLCTKQYTALQSWHKPQQNN
jgi:hypothetical protein